MRDTIIYRGAVYRLAVDPNETLFGGPDTEPLGWLVQLVKRLSDMRAKVEKIKPTAKDVARLQQLVGYLDQLQPAIDTLGK